MSGPTKRSLKGRSACRGIAAGQPKIVRSPKDLDAVNVGDILVATETDISFVPAMQRAGAVVTETGGRFCHAAVWARENNKPTILQVEGATAILADLRQVTVIADAGIIEWDE